uniref:Uncharacterized protein n=1 Tax=Leptobrachium leishanense TaxID=445787 RepID=A0A8C5M840_9ANUR
MPPVVQGMPNCLRSLAVCAMAVETVQSLTLGTDTILHTQHNVLHVLRNLSTQHISSQRLSGYETELTSTSNLSVKYSSVTSGPSVVLNALLRLREDHEEPRELHNCLPLIQLTTSPRSDLSDTPLEGPDIRHIFVDGSCSRPSDSQYLTGYAVVELPDIVHESASIPSNSSQAAELFALTAACKLFKDLPVTIYTDSRYAFGVVHDFGALWHRRGFTTAGRPISHSDLISDLLSAILLPSRLAVVKCKGHDPVDSFVSRGNHFADAKSKAAALSSPTISLVPHPPIVTCYLSPFLLPQKWMLKELQAGATEADVYHWASEGLVKSQEIPPDVRIYEKGGRVGLPAAAAPIFIFSFHGPGHRSPKLTYSEMAKHFSVCNLKAMINSQISRCLICARNNTQGPKIKSQHLPSANGPFQELQIDFTHMPTAKGNLKYLLVIVDKFSRCPEAFPTARENARTVAKILCKELIPRYGCPISIDSDNGPAFTSKITQELVKLMAIQWKFHCPYHAKSSGIVERQNRNIKNKLRKATEGTFKNWPDYLPAILAEIRMTTHSVTGLSPFEVLMGRPFPTPWIPKQGPLVMLPGDLDEFREAYVTQLLKTLHDFHRTVSCSFPPLSTDPTHRFVPGDRVLVKALHRHKTIDPPYGELTTVLAVTITAVLTDESPSWIHASRIKKAPFIPDPPVTSTPDVESLTPASR